MQDKEWLEGYQAFQAGTWSSHNPYREGTGNNVEWMAGWRAARINQEMEVEAVSGDLD